MSTGSPTLSQGAATVVDMTSRLLLSGLCLLAMLGACALIVWGMSSHMTCTASQCTYHTSMQHLENR